MKTKRHILYIQLAAAALLSGACTDIITESPDSYYEHDEFFTTPEKAEMAVLGVYNGLPTLYGEKDGMSLPCSDDIYYVNGTTADNGRRDVGHYVVRSNNTWVSGVWEGKYNIVNRANYTIAGIESMQGWQNSTTLLRLIAEAKFLRAQSALDLVRYWGDVPFKTEPTSGYENAYGPRVPREQIYDQVINDLNFAKEHLPWADEVGTPERASQGAARAMLMRALLSRAGYSLQADGKLSRPDGKTRSECYQAVVDEWLAFEAKGYHQFYSGGYEELFKSFSQGVLDTSESIFEVAFLAGKNNGYWGTYLGPQVTAPQISPTESSKYMGRANALFRVVPEWKDFFDATDQRRDVMVCTHSYNWNDATKSHVLTEQKNPRNWYPGKWRREWMPLGYIDPNKTDVNFCMLRYADVVLMAAEAYAEIGNSTEAWRLINLVRERAGAPEVSSANYATYYKAPKVHDLPYIADGDEAGRLRTAIYWERGFELAFEGQRKFDLLRWGVLGDALKLFGEKVDSRILSYIAGRNFVKGQHELLPIPQDEMQVNYYLNNTNNPGY